MRSRSVLGSERDDDVGRFGLVQLETRPAVVSPARNIHDLGRLGCRPGGLGGLNDVEPVAVKQERMFPEQIFELWNHGMVVGNGAGFELAQSSLELCGVKFHCALLSVRSRAISGAISRVAGPPTSRWSMRSSVIPRGRLKFFPTRRQLSNEAGPILGHDLGTARAIRSAKG